MEIVKNIVEKGNSLGFPVIKFVKAHPMSNEIKYFRNWLALKYNAGMDFLERNIEKREFIELLLTGTKTIIVFAYPYPGNVEFVGKLGLKIGKYAVVLDYHTAIKERLHIIGNYIFNEYRINSRSFVDTAPILEKQWAIKSGLGWQGKNSLIINPLLGSYFNIGIMLVDIELESEIDLKIKSQCGTCNKCIVACPTQAIVADKVIDCKKCIVKFAKNDINNLSAAELNVIKTTKYIWGCDICQDVCPYNKKRQKEGTVVYNLLNGIENMTEEKFNCTFQYSPIMRIGYKKIKMLIENLF